MKKVRKQQKGIPFLLALLLIFSIFVPISFADSQNTMKEFRNILIHPRQLDQQIQQKTLSRYPNTISYLRDSNPTTISLSYSPNPGSSPTVNFIFDKTTGTITGHTGSTVHLVIPEQIDGVPVQYIGEGAFANAPFTAVTIPDSVISIKKEAFAMCENLRSLTLGNSLYSIGDLAFIGCQITTLNLPTSLHNIDFKAFYDNNIHTLNFAPYSELETIGPLSFTNNNLCSLTIPSSVRTIEYHAFENNQISDLILENGLQSIGFDSFYNNHITSLVIPDSVQTIVGNAFVVNPLETVELAKHTTIISHGFSTEAFPENTTVIRRP